jgi:acyl-coenzyme A thioesterase 9
MSTTGVFRELTAMRVPTPWIQAFNQRKEMEEGKRSGVVGTSSTISEQTPTKEQGKLMSKRMSDSYHSVVSVLSLIFIKKITSIGS